LRTAVVSCWVRSGNLELATVKTCQNRLLMPGYGLAPCG
jgi:hypothetical protein